MPVKHFEFKIISDGLGPKADNGKVVSYVRIVPQTDIYD